MFSSTSPWLRLAGLTALLAAGCRGDGGNLNQLPDVAADVATTPEDVAVVVDVLANDSDPDGDALALYSQMTAENGTASRTSDETIRFEPDPDFFGEATISYTVTDGQLGVRQRLTVIVEPVNDPPVAAGKQVQSGRNGVSIPLEATDVDGDRLWFAVERGPEHGSVDLDGDVVTYRPFDGYAGPDRIVYFATDGDADSESAVIDVDVLAGSAPVPEAMTISTPEDVAVSFALRATDADGDDLTFTVTEQPAHGLLGGTAPDLTYYPNTNFTGTDRISFEVSDGILTSGTAVVTINVGAVGDPPIAEDAAATTAEDTAVSVTLVGSDPDGDSLIFSVSSPPTAGQATMITFDRVRYQPPPDFTGQVSFQVVASDGNASSAPATVTIEVTPVNDPPVAAAQLVDTDEDASVAIALAATDVDSGALTYQITSGPQNGTLTGTPPSLTYQPAADFAGTDSFSFAASDGSLASAPAEVTVQVAPVNDPPVVAPVTVSADEDQPTGFGIPATDIDSTGLTYEIELDPDFARVSGSGPTFELRPRPNVSGTSVGTVTVSDGELSATADLTVVIAPVEDDPIARDDNVQTSVDVAVEIDAIANDDDFDGDAIAIVEAGPAQSGTVTVTAGGAVRYQPSPGFTGTDLVEYTIEDDTGRQATGEIRIGVGRFPDNLPLGWISQTTMSPEARPALSADGRYVVAVTPGAGLVTVRDRIDLAIEVISVAPDGTAAAGSYSSPAISADGRFVAFASDSPELVAGDDNGASDIFVRDRETGVTTLVSRASDGTLGNGDSTRVDISADGRYVVFDSRAFNLVDDDFNGSSDVFWHDRETGDTVRVSLDAAGLEGDGDSWGSRISGDGQVVAFTSVATDLVAGDTNGASDIFVYELATGLLERVSVSSVGAQGDLPSHHPELSFDGRFVGFLTESALTGASPQNDNLFVHDRQTDNTQLASANDSGRPVWRVDDFALSDDGRYALFLYSRSSGPQLYIRDRFAGDIGEVYLLGQGQSFADRLWFAVLSPDASYVATAWYDNGGLYAQPNPL